MPKYSVVVNGMVYRHSTFPLVEDINCNDYLVFRWGDMGIDASFPVSKITSLIIVCEG